MGSWGQVGLGILGAAVGYYFGGVGGAYLGGSLGMAAGSFIDPPGSHMGGMSQYEKQDIYYNTIAHNLPVPIIYGVNRVAGNLMWFGNVHADVTTSGGGGKTGGSGGGDGKKGSQGQQEVNVYVDFAIAIGEGEIAAVTEVFIGDRLISETEGLTYTVYLGTNEQTPDPLLIKDLGDLAPAFRNTAYISMGGNIGMSPSVPQVNTEVVGKFTTPFSWGNPALIVEDILINQRYGIGIDPTRIDTITFTAAYSYCVGLVESGVTSAQAAALDHPYVPPSFATITSMSMINMLYRTMVIGGLPPGYSVGMYFPDGTRFAATDVISSNGVAVMSSSIISSMGWTEDPGGGNDPIQHFTPTSGYIVLFEDATYTTVVSNGTWPTPPGVMDFYIGTMMDFTPGEPSYTYPRLANGLPGEQRYCLDYIIDAYQPVVEHLRDMLASFGAFITWSQGIVKLHIEQPGSTIIQSFGMEEIVSDSFRWKRQSYRDRPNVVRVQYVEPGPLTPNNDNPTANDALISGTYIRTGDQLSYKHEYKTYRQDFVEASDPWDINRTGERRDRVLNLVGIKRRSQAQRMAYYYLNKAVHCGNACTFRVSINGLQAEVGDVIAISHDIPRWQGKLFRIAEIQEAENDELTLGCLEHSESVYSDSPHIGTHGQDTLYGTGSGAGGRPTSVGRLSVYERPYEDVVEIAYTRIATADMFTGTEIYVSRGGGDYSLVTANILTDAPTAYLDSSINTFTLVTSGPLVGWSTSDPITITGIPDGYAGALYHWYEALQSMAVASMGTIILPVNVTTRTNGYIRIFSTIDSADNGSHRITGWPDSFDAPYRPGDLFAYRRIPQVISASQNYIPIERPMGGWTSGLSLRIETEEIGFTTFTDSRLTGVTRGAHGTPAVTHTGVCSIQMVAVQTISAEAPFGMTSDFRDPLSNVEFFTQNSAMLYIGANSKFTAMNIWLARNASQMLGMVGEYSTGQGTWASLTSSGFIKPIDTTSGMQWFGQVSWEPPGNWTPSHMVTAGGFDIGDNTDRYYFRLMRVASLCTVPPVEMEMTLTNDVLVTARLAGAYLYRLTLADSGQMLMFKAVSRSMGGAAGDSVGAPVAGYWNV